MPDTAAPAARRPLSCQRAVACDSTRKVTAINRIARPAVREVWSHSATRFLFVGGLSYLFDVGVLVCLHGALGVPLGIATSVAFTSTLLVNFGLNKIFAFRSPGLLGPALVRYGLLVLVNYGTTLLMVTGLTAAGLSYVVAKTLATVVNAALNYEAYRRWVFRNGR